MTFEKDGVKYDLRDQAHIDCFRAKGWRECTEPTEPKEKPTKTPRSKKAE